MDIKIRPLAIPFQRLVLLTHTHLPLELLIASKACQLQPDFRLLLLHEIKRLQPMTSIALLANTRMRHRRLAHGLLQRRTVWCG